ncbi:MAG: hypothetical protein KJP21_08145 [Bacteroidia bacterium]|nr:hypothetical protein [Bacteroidia bacterium]
MFAISGCEEKELSNELYQISDPIEGDTISTSPCNLEEFAEVKGELNFSGTFTKTVKKYNDFEDIKLEWGSSKKIIIRYHHASGFKHALTSGRKVELGTAFFVEFIVSYKDFGTWRDYNGWGSMYLIPYQDGTLEIDWCDLTLYVDGYTAMSKGGVKIIP